MRFSIVRKNLTIFIVNRFYNNWVRMESIGRKEELRRTLEPQENLVVFLDELPDAVEKLDEIASWASGQTPQQPYKEA